MADTGEMTLQTDVGGLRAVDMQYRGIREIETGSIAFFQSATKLNTPGLGTLAPETFRPVAELSKQSITLFELEMEQAIETMGKLKERDFYFRWLSVYMPMNYLMERACETRLVSYIDEKGVDSNRLCFELSPTLLRDGNLQVARVIANLRNRGFHFLISDFGGTRSPLMKLSDFQVDYVILSRELTGYIGKSERSNAALHSVIQFVNGLGADPIADGISNATQAEVLYQNECRYVAGPLAGKYTAERYLRKKTDAILEEENT